MSKQKIEKDIKQLSEELSKEILESLILAVDGNHKFSLSALIEQSFREFITGEEK